MKLKDFDVIFSEGKTDLFSYIKNISGKYSVFVVSGFDSSVETVAREIESRTQALQIAYTSGHYSGELIF